MCVITYSLLRLWHKKMPYTDHGILNIRSWIKLVSVQSWNNLWQMPGQLFSSWCCYSWEAKCCTLHKKHHHLSNTSVPWPPQEKHKQLSHWGLHSSEMWHHVSDWYLTLWDSTVASSSRVTLHENFNPWRLRPSGSLKVTHQAPNNVAPYPRKTVLLQNPKNSHPTWGNTTLTLELFPFFFN